MRACEHFKKPFGDETEIVPSEGHLWNGWVQVFEGYKLIFSTFETGIFWDYLEHLSTNGLCRKEVGISAEEVDRLLREIEKEWEQAVK
jgi:hypothetical protein